MPDFVPFLAPRQLRVFHINELPSPSLSFSLPLEPHSHIDTLSKPNHDCNAKSGAETIKDTMPNYVFSGTLLISLKDVIYLQLNTAKDHKELYINLINRVPNRVLQYAATKQESVGSRLIEIQRRRGERERANLSKFPVVTLYVQAWANFSNLILFQLA